MVTGPSLQVTAKNVRCTGITFASFNLGDLDDTFYAEGYVPVLVRGGIGNDTIEGNLSRFGHTVPGTPAFRYGQAGDDHLIGGMATTSCTRELAPTRPSTAPWATTSAAAPTWCSSPANCSGRRRSDPPRSRATSSSSRNTRTAGAG